MLSGPSKTTATTGGMDHDLTPNRSKGRDRNEFEAEIEEEN